MSVKYVHSPVEVVDFTKEYTEHNEGSATPVLSPVIEYTLNCKFYNHPVNMDGILTFYRDERSLDVTFPDIKIHCIVFRPIDSGQTFIMWSFKTEQERDSAYVCIRNTVSIATGNGAR